jgi:hypothetical protein
MANGEDFEDDGFGNMWGQGLQHMPIEDRLSDAQAVLGLLVSTFDAFEGIRP